MSIDIKSRNPLQHSPFCPVLALSSGNIPSCPPHGHKPWGPALNISGVFPYTCVNRYFIQVSLTTCWSVSPSFFPGRALMNADSSRADMGCSLDGLSLDRRTGDYILSYSLNSGFVIDGLFFFLCPALFYPAFPASCQHRRAGIKPSIY